MDSEEVAGQSEMVTIIPNGKHNEDLTMPVKTPPEDDGFLLTVVAVLSCYSIHLLLKSSGVVGIRAYEQLGYRAFGTPGKLAAGIAITLQNIGAMSSYLYIVKYEFPLVIQAFLNISGKSDEWYLNGNYLVVLVSVCVILPLALMKQLGYLGYTSGFSLSCMVFFLCVVIYKKFQIPCPFFEFSFNTTESLNSSTSMEHSVGYQNGHTQMEADPDCSPRMFTLNSQTAYTIPILAFAFVCHPEVLPIYTELRKNPALSAPQVRRAIQQMLFPNKAFNWLRHIAIAICLLILINLLVIFAPNILGIFGIIGATSAPCLIFIFPAIFYIRIVPTEEEPMRSTPKIMAACFAGLGVLFMIMSLSFIIIDWTTGSDNANGGGH
ncbi:UNVERIFIED_CONTAM: hypothetical protein FKN15_035167 [Acipenser sinensis]